MTITVATVVTSRSQYSRIKTVLQALDQHPDVNLCLFLSGGALVHRFGELTEIVEEAGLTVDQEIHTLLEAGEPIAQAKTAGMGLIEYASALKQTDPDIFLTSGDRYETMAATISASYLNIPVAHLEGGEMTGSIDDKVRHATTKMADYHFVSTKQSQQVVERLGEHSDRVYHTGCPSMDMADEIAKENNATYDPQEEYGGVGDYVNVEEEYIIVQYHPLPTEYQSNYEKTWELINAYEQLDVQAFWFWPNMDAGTDQVSKAIRQYREKQDPDDVRFFISLDPHDHLTLVRNAACMVGNSSVGIRECSYFGVPSVNIGNRQQSRERGPNVIDVDTDADSIADAIRTQLQHGRYQRSTLYGDGGAGEAIADIIADLDPTRKHPMTPESLHME